MDARDLPIKCTLPPDNAVEQATEWVEMRAFATSVEPIAQGVVLRFPSSMAARLEALVAREARCCAFLSLSVTLEGPACVVTIRSDNPAGTGVVELLGGVVGR